MDSSISTMVLSGQQVLDSILQAVGSGAITAEQGAIMLRGATVPTTNSALEESNNPNTEWERATPVPDYASREYKQPSWYIDPSDQIDRLHVLNAVFGWGLRDNEIPRAAPNIPLMGREVILLSVYLNDVNVPEQDIYVPGLYRTLVDAYKAVKLPCDYDKYLGTNFKQVKTSGFRVTNTPDWEPGVRWVVFNPDPEAFTSKTSSDARKVKRSPGVYLASVEVLWAMVMFPDWVKAFLAMEEPFPQIGGLTAKRSVIDRTESVGPTMTHQGNEFILTVNQTIYNDGYQRSVPTIERVVQAPRA